MAGANFLTAKPSWNRVLVHSRQLLVEKGKPRRRSICGFPIDGKAGAAKWTLLGLAFFRLQRLTCSFIPRRALCSVADPQLATHQ